jgi:hypothetical protein
MTGFKKILSHDLKAGMRFSAPIFFDDGENMFLAEGKPVKQYHLMALMRWSVPFLLTYGSLLSIASQSESESTEDLEPLEELTPEEIPELK